ncbi:choice-of-anchor Q domain-containing protein [Kaarinaea lacus]
MNTRNLFINLKRLTCSLAFLGFLAIPSLGGAVDITVTGLTDAVDAAGSDPAVVCTGAAPVSCANLRSAIRYANEVSPDPDVITLPAGTYTLSLDGVDETWSGAGTEADPYVADIIPDATQGDLDITDSLTINGAVDLNNYVTTTIAWDTQDITDPDVGDRIFHVQAPTGATLSVTFSNLILMDGSVGVIPNTNCDVLDNPYDIDVIPGEFCNIWQFRRYGGALALGPGAGIAFYEEAIHGPDTPGGGGKKPPDIGPGGDEGEGGTIADVTISRVAVIDNKAGADAGGIYNAAPTLIEESVISGNFSGANGGGIYNDAEMTINKTLIGTASFSDVVENAALLVNPNQGENGGGLFDTGFHTTTITSSAINGNTAIGGGGIAGRSLIVFDVTNTTISGNVASDVGGGITTNGTINLTNTTVVNNEASTDAPGGGAGLNSFGSGTYNMLNTIVANNLKNTTVDSNCGCSGGSVTCAPGRMVSLGYNLENADTCELGMASDLVNTNPELLALADNGGGTETHALQHTQNGDGVDSPGVDAGDTANCPNNDQRGSIRPADGDLDDTFDCDIGAYELFIATADLHIENMVAPDEVDKGDEVTVTITVHNPVTATAAATDVAIGATVPVEFTGVTGSLLADSDCTVTGADVTCPVIPNLAVDDSATLTLVFTAANEGEFTVDTSVSAATPADTKPGNNSASATIKVIGESDLSLTASLSRGEVDEDKDFGVILVVTNAGPDDATNVRLAGTKSPLITLLSANPDNGSTCTAEDEQVVCELGDVTMAVPVSVHMVFRALSPGTGTLSAEVTGDQNDPDLDNNAGSVTITINKEEDKNFFEKLFGCTLSQGVFDPTLLFVVILSLLHLARRTIKVKAIRK